MVTTFVILSFWFGSSRTQAFDNIIMPDMATCERAAQAIMAAWNPYGNRLKSYKCVPINPEGK